MKTLHHFVDNKDGWLLSLHQTWRPERLVAGRRPVVIVPGYGMNSHIFSYHPTSVSLEGHLVDQGFEVWRLDMRGQGDAVRRGGRPDYGVSDLALTDLGTALDAIVDRTRTGNDDGRVDVLGASLGGSLMFAHAVLAGERRLGTLVSMGSPLRWVDIHPAIKVAFAVPALVGLVPVRGTRALVSTFFPHLIRHTPWLLSIYIASRDFEPEAAREMAKTVEDPSRLLNRQMAEWFRSRDLIVNGRNIATGLRDVKRPLFVTAARGDGIVPLRTALSPYELSGASEKAVLEVGDDTLAMAHADLFVANDAHRHVFDPIADWLLRHEPHDAKVVPISADSPTAAA